MKTAYTALLLICFALPANAQAPASQFEEKTIPIFGQTIHYWDVGTGPAVVLLHGLGSRKDDWRAVVQPLSQKHRVLVPDQIGFGKSDKPLLDYTIHTYIDFLNEFLRQLKVENATLVGESMGGWIAGADVLEATKNPHITPIEKLVLVDAAGLHWDRTAPVVKLNPSTVEDMRAILQAVFYDTSWLTDDVLRGIWAQKLAQNDFYTVHSLLSGFGNQTAEGIEDHLAEIHLPTLVIWGRQDALLSLSYGQRYAAGITGAKMVVIDKCGHVPPAEQPAQFVAAVSAFLDGAH